MKHVIHNFIASCEMEADAARILLGHAQKALAEFGAEGDPGRAREGLAPASGQRCLRAEEPTWQDKMDEEIKDTEARLQNRLCECDRILEVLTVNG